MGLQLRAYSLIHQQQEVGGRGEKEKEHLGSKAWAFETLKSTSNKTTPPSLSKSSYTATPWLRSIQIYEPIGTILTQTTTYVSIIIFSIFA